MADGSAGLLLVFAVVVGFEVAERVSVALRGTFCDLSRQPRTRKHTKPNSKSDRPVDEAFKRLKCEFKGALNWGEKLAHAQKIK